jgi:hypothetical protein
LFDTFPKPGFRFLEPALEEEILASMHIKKQISFATDSASAHRIHDFTLIIGTG